MENNPLITALRTRIPGETFRLPSRGLFYTNGELAERVSEGEVHVYPLSVIDEITLKSPDKLYSGQAIEDVFKRCIPDIIKPLELLSRDVDFLLVCLKLLSHGDIITLEYKHDCPRAKKQEYNISLRPLLTTSRSIDPTTIGTSYLITMKSDQKVKLRPPLIRDILTLYRTSQENKNNEAGESLMEVQESILEILGGMILAVDDIDDPKLIIEWLHTIRPEWVEELNAQAATISEWGVNPQVDIICKQCDTPVKIEVPINPINFFL